jgi:oxaloacetate decarboxylase alpha subunit
MDVSGLRELIRIFEQAAITELDYEVKGVRIRLKKDQNRVAAAQGEVALPATDDVPGVGEQAGTAQSYNVNSPVVHGDASALREREVSAERPVISAPMVGVCYRSPAPDAPPFVQPGDFIEEGQTVCVIEAMKLMNEVRSPLSGRLVEVLVENGEPVEFGQPLFVLESVMT